MEKETKQILGMGILFVGGIILMSFIYASYLKPIDEANIKRLRKEYYSIPSQPKKQPEEEVDLSKVTLFNGPPNPDKEFGTLVDGPVDPANPGKIPFSNDLQLQPKSEEVNLKKLKINSSLKPSVSLKLLPVELPTVTIRSKTAPLKVPDDDDLWMRLKFKTKSKESIRNRMRESGGLLGCQCKNCRRSKKPHVAESFPDKPNIYCHCKQCKAAVKKERPADAKAKAGGKEKKR